MAQVEQDAEKVLFVIPSEARDLLFYSASKKRRFLGQTPPFGMTDCEFPRSLFSLWGLVLARRKIHRLEAYATFTSSPS